jgi:hypothetical protein
VITKKEIVFLLIFLLSGLLGGWLFINHQRKLNNTPEKIVQRIVNNAIQDDFCERIQADLNEFKKLPASFQRSSLRIIQIESKQTLRKLLVGQGVPEDFPLEYKGQGSSIDRCLPDVKAWLNIPSVGSQSMDEEFSELGIDTKTAKKSEPNNIQKDSLPQRVALVIGNYDYRNRPLKNPKADSEDMRDFLTDAGFKVFFIENASFAKMNDGVNLFLDALKFGEVGFIYYSGHGVEYKGRNYLLPVNFNASDEEEIPRQALDISAVVEKISKAERKVNIVIIDACRSSFVTSKNRSVSSGLHKMDGARGTILAFSTAPGKVAEDGNGRNSPYTKHLLKSMSVPGRKIEDVFKETARNVEVETVGRQIPWYNSSLMVDFSLK